MRTIAIYQGSLELAEFDLESPHLLIGRSPLCNVVLRTKGVEPIHFIVEWMGEGEFSPESGSWLIFDVSGTAGRVAEHDALNAGAGQGTFLSDDGVKLGRFRFEFKRDRLTPTVLKKGVVLGTLEKQTGTSPKKSGYVLEVAEFQAEIDRILDVRHYSLSGFWKKVLIAPGTSLKAKAPVGAGSQLRFSAISGAETASLLTSGLPVSTTQGDVAISFGEGLWIRTADRSFLLRLASKVSVPPVSLELLRDYFTRLVTAGGLIFVILLIWFLGGEDPRDLEERKPPPRIAKIQIKQVIPPKAPDAPKAETKGKQVPEVRQAKAKETPVANGEAFSKPRQPPPPKPAPPAAGLNSPAKPKNINKVGLLGILSKPKTQNTVSADKILDDATRSKTVSGKSSDLVVLNSPTGVVGERTEIKDTNLAEASTTLATSGSYSLDSAGGFADSLKGKSGYQIGQQGGERAAGGKSGLEGVGGEGSPEVQGGLDKETVKRVIRAHTRMIRKCYETALLNRPDLSGAFKYKWVISEKGPVLSVDMISAAIDSPGFQQCLKTVISQMRFPEAPNGQRTIVMYPFFFQSSGR